MEVAVENDLKVHLDNLKVLKDEGFITEQEYVRRVGDVREKMGVVEIKRQDALHERVSSTFGKLFSKPEILQGSSTSFLSSITSKLRNNPEKESNEPKEALLPPKRPDAVMDVNDIWEQLSILKNLHAAGFITEQEYHTKAQPHRDFLGLDKENMPILKTEEEKKMYEEAQLKIGNVLSSLESTFSKNDNEDLPKITWIKNKSPNPIFVKVYSGWLGWLRPSKVVVIYPNQDQLVSASTTNAWHEDFHIEIHKEEVVVVEIVQPKAPEKVEVIEKETKLVELEVTIEDEKEEVKEIEAPKQKREVMILDKTKIVDVLEIVISDEEKPLIQPLKTSDLPQQLVIYEKTREAWETEDFYEILQCPRDATPEQLKQSFYRLIRLYHPDKGEADVLKAKRVIQAYTVLSNEEERKKYDALLNNGATRGAIKQFFSKAYWQQAYQDGRLKHIVLQAALITAGIAITVATAGAGIAVALPCAAVGGAMLSIGVGGYKYVSSDECARDGVTLEQYKKIMLTYGSIGAVAGALSFGATSIAIASAPVATGVVTGIVDGAVWGASGAVSDGIYTGQYKELIEEGNAHLIAADVAKGVIMGGVLGGAAGGAVSGLVSASIPVSEVSGEVTGVFQRTAREGVEELTGAAVAFIQGTGRAAGVATRNLIQGMGEKLLLETDSTQYLDEPPPLLDPMEPLVEQPEPLPLPSHNFLVFQDDGLGLYIKMHITYEDEGKEWNLVKKSREVVCLPQTAENIFVMFQVARAPKVYAPIKKWDRKKKDWVVPEQIHEFYYSRPPCRRFIITGSLYFEKISEVQAEDHSPVDD
eukprot:TRINITY_DN1819_c0_g1_i1.p1 TRINITY_DN1819_c0_g1~~TRINITY_DN1819_c0_g1_i1.p1  ORF type:complete len:814 (-),score=252.33 TRINITY_DN1819_c0_g1_i1:39-2480(-)